jgi:hypothetical protein
MSADAERRPRRVGEDIVVALYRPAELFSVQPEAMLERDARIEPGADEIVNELLGRSSVQRRARIGRDAARGAAHPWYCRDPARRASTVLRGAAKAGSA